MVDSTRHCPVSGQYLYGCEQLLTARSDGTVSMTDYPGYMFRQHFGQRRFMEVEWRLDSVVLVLQLPSLSDSEAKQNDDATNYETSNGAKETNINSPIPNPVMNST